MPTASLVMTTKNRCEDLRRALVSAVNQSVELEIVVIDDGSDDETSDMVSKEFPSVHLIRHEQSGGVVRRRNEGAELAKGDILFSIDDDAEFSSADVVEQTLRDFDRDEIGAVAIPYINVKQNNELLQCAPDCENAYCMRTFIGTAYALRRDVFLECGQYRPEVFHQGEERDFCIRMLDAGYVVRVGRADPIWHYESPNRDSARMDIYGRRNDILFAWWNVPLLCLPWQLAGTVVKGTWFALRSGHFLRHTRGYLKGFWEMPRYFHLRRAVRYQTFRRYRKLKNLMPLDEIF